MLKTSNRYSTGVLVKHRAHGFIPSLFYIRYPMAAANSDVKPNTRNKEGCAAKDGFDIQGF
jgi:hypothetical protein